MLLDRCRTAERKRRLSNEKTGRLMKNPGRLFIVRPIWRADMEIKVLKEIENVEQTEQEGVQTGFRLIRFFVCSVLSFFSPCAAITRSCSTGAAQKKNMTAGSTRNALPVGRPTHFVVQWLNSAATQRRGVIL